MADTASTASAPTNRDFVSQAYATGGLPPLIALLLPFVIALCGLAAIALTPKADGSAAIPSLDLTITGSIVAAPLFDGLGHASR